MAEQIIFFNKNQADISDESVVATASQGDDYTDYALNRKNDSAWITTGSVDSDNTYFEIDYVDEKTITDILLIKHNFKAFTIQYYDGSYKDFSTPINETNNTDDSTHFTFNSVSTTKIKLIVTGTQTADQDKYLYQFISTTQIGQLNAYPEIKQPTLSRNRKKQKMLSGKLNILESVGAFSTTLKVKVLSSDADLTIIENLYSANEGFLVWLCGGDESQFKNERMGYRMEDIYLMKCVDEWTPEYYKGMYQRGMKIDIKLGEVVD